MTELNVRKLLTNLEAVIKDSNTNQILEETNENHIKEFLTGEKPLIEMGKRADSVSLILERIASDALMGKNNEKDIKFILEWFKKAFVLRRSELYTLKTKEVEKIFYFSVCGIVSRDLSQIRVLLKSVKIPESKKAEWDEIIKYAIMKSMILLIRKSNGWSDVKNALKLIDDLKRQQKDFEEPFIEKHPKHSIPNLISLYNMVRMVELATKYILSGQPSDIINQIKRHYDNTKRVESFASTDDLSLLKDMLFLGCTYLVKNSIWYNTRNLVTVTKIKNYIEKITKDIKHPIIDLLPSQQDALSEELLSLVKRSIVLNMPTSAGKTMMAEFSIVQAKSVNEEAKIIYVVPTRALVNQVTLYLRRKLGKINLVVESAVPVFELDPIEDDLLKHKIDVLVSTPEKLELLIKDDHPSVRNVALVIVDEAHNIQQPERGAKLELLLSTINREKENVRFLLLSPFIPNAKEIATWLGNEQSKEISIDWRANDQVTAVSFVSKKRGGPEFVRLRVLPSHTNKFISKEFNIDFSGSVVEGNRSIKKTSLSTALNLLPKEGCILILCMTRNISKEIATKLSERMKKIELDEESKLIIDYIEEELGVEHTMTKMLRKGVAFHCSDLTYEIRYLIERLVEKGTIRIVVATTTLAQGVNFPIKHVIVNGTWLGSPIPEQRRHLEHSELWNIAGRAGRAFNDHMGSIIFSMRSKKEIDKYRKYIKTEADKILSSILYALKQIQDIKVKFNLNFVRIHKTFANFLQYLFHVVRISSYNEVNTDLDNILRSSLAFHQLENEDPENAYKLIQLSKNYLESIGIIAENRGLVELIDKTGFTSISVNRILAEKDLIIEKDLWKIEDLFSEENTNLRKIVDVLKDIPEIDLARFLGGPLNTETIAKIVKDWVNGKSILEIGNKYFKEEKDPSERATMASDYINNKLMGYIAWGLGALQRVSAFYNKDLDFEKISHLPAMIFYGVNTRESTILRMAGVPRQLTERFSKDYEKKFGKKMPTFGDIRQWLSGLEDSKWTEASKFSKIKGKRAKKLWRILNGIE